MTVDIMYSVLYNFRKYRLYAYAVFDFFFIDTATTEIYTLSLHDALPICLLHLGRRVIVGVLVVDLVEADIGPGGRSEEHTSELQSQFHLVCRLLLEKKKISFRHRTSLMINLIMHARKLSQSSCTASLT